jgi:subtilisin family serine protease
MSFTNATLANLRNQSTKISVLAVLLSLGLSGCSSQSQDGADESASTEGVITEKTAESEIIPGRFIVTVDPSVDPSEVIRDHGVNPQFVYNKAIKGFAGSISDAARAGLLGDHRVVEIEQDQVVKASDLQTNPTWGLDRIDQRALPLDASYGSVVAGSSVTAYIIDTGILLNHIEFTGRASFGFDAFGGDGGDCNGHGTHVSGTVGGTTYGVAKGVNLVAVRVLDCNGSGSTSGVIAGIDWVATHHVPSSVANLSLGGGASTALDTAMKRMILSGVATAVAAGNEGRDACSYSPARVSEAMTVGASSISDVKASWSNYGKCVDWFAPGVSITSAWSTGVEATNTISGTSMASPHTAGVAALYLDAHPGASPVQVRDALLSFTTKSIITSSSTTNNHLLHSLEAAIGSGDYVTPAVALTNPADGAVVARRSYVTLSALASDNVLVKTVEFYANGSRVCTDSITPFSCVWRAPATSGTVTLQARALDVAGNVGGSQLVTIKIQ